MLNRCGYSVNTMNEFVATSAVLASLIAMIMMMVDIRMPAIIRERQRLVARMRHRI